MSVAGVGENEKEYLRGGKSICLIDDFQLIRGFSIGLLLSRIKVCRSVAK